MIKQSLIKQLKQETEETALLKQHIIGYDQIEATYTKSIFKSEVTETKTISFLDETEWADINEVLIMKERLGLSILAQAPMSFENYIHEKNVEKYLPLKINRNAHILFPYLTELSELGDNIYDTYFRPEPILLKFYLTDNTRTIQTKSLFLNFMKHMRSFPK